MLTHHFRGGRVVRCALVMAAALGFTVLTPSPSQATFGSKITITAIRPAYTIPNTPGDYPLVTTGDAFSVDISTDGWFTLLGSTPLILTADSGPEAGKVLARTSLPALSTTATFTGAVLTKEALGVRLKAAVDKPNPDATPGYAFVDVLDNFVATGPSTPLLSILGGGGVNKHCEPTTAEPLCLEMQTPTGAVTSDQLLAEGQCDPTLGCTTATTFTWLANITSQSQLVLQCDKTFCRGTGVPHFIATAQLSKSSTPFTVPDCPSPTTVGADQKICEATGNRTGVGDLVLVFNWTEDGRITIK